MKLLTKELRRKIPMLYSQENNPDPMVVCKFFTPWAGWTWFSIEASARYEEDGEVKYAPLKDADESWDVLFFGWVCGQENELGYFTLSQLLSVRGPGRIGVERDMYFMPRPLSKVKEDHRKHGAACSIGWL